MEFKDKKVLVCGMAKSGISAAVLLKKLGAQVILQDIKAKELLGDISEFIDMGIEIYAGKNPDDIIKDKDFLVVSPGIPTNLPFFNVAKELNVPVLSEVEFSFLLTPCPIVAITGTNGKTTTTAITGEIIRRKYENAVTVGNIGVPFSSKVLSLNKDDYVVIELSSFQLENIHKFKPSISAVLNISPDHIDRHKTYENYILAKEKIFENQDENDYLILNYNDPICLKMAKKTKANVIYFSSGEIPPEGIYLENGNIILKLRNKCINIIKLSSLQVLGIHNYENVMVASAIAYFAGVSIEDIREGLKSFRGVEHRIEFVSGINGINYYNDSKGTNVSASVKAVLAMERPTVLIAGGYDKSAEYDELVKSFENKVKAVVLIGQTSDKIIECMEKYSFSNYEKAKTLEDAVKKCSELAKKGEAVLLSPACASWDMFKSFEERGNLFKEYVLSMK